MLWSPSPAELQEGERGLARLAGWIDEHLERFLSVSGGSRLDHFKPASELALLLLALTTPAQRQSASAFARWGQQIAHDFAAALAKTTDQLDWSALEQPGTQGDQLAPLLVFPLLEQVGDLRFACSGRIAPLLDRLPAAPDFEWYFLRGLLYGDDYDALLGDWLAHTLDMLADPACRTRISRRGCAPPNLPHCHFCAEKHKTPPLCEGRGERAPRYHPAWRTDAPAR